MRFISTTTKIRENERRVIVRALSVIDFETVSFVGIYSVNLAPVLMFTVDANFTQWRLHETDDYSFNHPKSN